MSPGLDVARAAGSLERRIGNRPGTLLVLGSGSGGLADAVEGTESVGFDEVEGLPGTGVAGHAGRFLAGELEGRPVLVQAGRYHLYEGRSPVEVVAPVRIAGALGVETVVFTNAAGGIRRDLEPGSLMLLDDHLDLQQRSPLAGPVREGEARFPDMSAPYDPELAGAVERVSSDLGIPLARGVYAAMTGPSFETPAEIRMLDRLGADAVGMSTVPSVIVARAMGLRVLAFSTITNRAAGLSPAPLTHDEVMAVGERAGHTLERLLRGLLARDEGSGASGQPSSSAPSSD